MSISIEEPVDTFRVECLRVAVYRDRAAAARAAAEHVRFSIARFVLTSGRARLVFAAAPSQTEFLEALRARDFINWSGVTAFHMDEYLGLTSDHASSFRHYLAQQLFRHIPLAHDRIRLIHGERKDRPLEECLRYEDALRAEPPDVVCAGIGENGHLAFNDPPVADFIDPVWVKLVRLDEPCRAQQVHDGCFARLEDVPTHAYTLTIPALMTAAVVSVMVPGTRKAQAVRDALRGPISEACPASVLRRHAGATLWLDADAASLL